MNILERARKVGRLSELMEKQGDFDWNGVPELSPEEVQSRLI
jgi:hypothetical protein